MLLSYLSLASCNKPKYNACFTTSKDTYSVNEKVVFKNCSDFDGGFTICQWNFDDNPVGVANSNGLDSVSYSYTQKGLKKIVLRIGEKENDSQAEKVIEIK